MATLKSVCPTCGKTMKLKYETPFGKKVLRAYVCGHTFFTDFDSEPSTVESPEPSPADVSQCISSLESTFNEDSALSQFDDDGNVIQYPSVDPSFYSLDHAFCAYEFQQEGVRFAEKTKFNCLIADAMGLGKTIQALITVKRNLRTLAPVLYIVKGSTSLQWCNELKKWLNNDPMGVMLLINRECMISGFQHYVISMDFISRKGVLEKLLRLGIKCVVLDECQAYKDDSSKRTKALITLIQEGRIEYCLALSGTPIKNRAIEYFPILNLLDPERFYSKIGFARNWLEPNEKGIYTRIAPGMLDHFHDVTGKYIIRREKRDVLKNLPPLRRDFVLVEIEDPAIKKIYNGELDLFANFLNSAGKVNSTVLLGWLAKMRAIAGQAKVPWAMEYLQNTLDDTDESLAIGIHHHSVRDTLYVASKAMGYDPLKLSGEDSIWRKDAVQTAFNEGRNRLLIINALAGGVGLNLQKACHHFVVLERMWNSADEEQFEARFDRDGQKYPVEATYAIAAGTIDEWFHEMIAEKRKIIRETMGDSGSFNVTEDEEFLKNLVERTLGNKLK
jgi:SNF2 family DNA or RNA helicase